MEIWEETRRKYVVGKLFESLMSCPFASCLSYFLARLLRENDEEMNFLYSHFILKNLNFSSVILPVSTLSLFFSVSLYRHERNSTIKASNSLHLQLITKDNFAVLKGGSTYRQIVMHCCTSR